MEDDDDWFALLTGLAPDGFSDDGSNNTSVDDHRNNSGGSGSSSSSSNRNRRRYSRNALADHTQRAPRAQHGPVAVPVSTLPAAPVLEAIPDPPPEMALINAGGTLAREEEAEQQRRQFKRRRKDSLVDATRAERVNVFAQNDAGGGLLGRGGAMGATDMTAAAAAAAAIAAAAGPVATRLGPAVSRPASGGGGGGGGRQQGEEARLVRKVKELEADNLMLRTRILEMQASSSARGSSSSASPAPSGSGPLSESDRAQTMRMRLDNIRQMERAFNAGTVDAFEHIIEETYTEDVELLSPVIIDYSRGRPAIQKFWGFLLINFPDASITLHSPVADDARCDHVQLRWDFQGTSLSTTPIEMLLQQWVGVSPNQAVQHAAAAATLPSGDRAQDKEEQEQVQEQAQEQDQEQEQEQDQEQEQEQGQGDAQADGKKQSGQFSISGHMLFTFRNGLICKMVAIWNTTAAIQQMLGMSSRPLLAQQRFLKPDIEARRDQLMGPLAHIFQQHTAVVPSAHAHLAQRGRSSSSRGKS